MASSLVLLVDDDIELANMLVLLLAREGIQALAVFTGEAGRLALHSIQPAVVLLDMMLPDANGLDLCRQWRLSDPGLGILMLSARGDPMDRVLGLEMGADDYLAKPFEKRELVARVRALLRRSQPAGPTTPELQCGALTVHLSRREVSVQGQPMPLSRIEFKLPAELTRTGVPRAVERGRAKRRLPAAGPHRRCAGGSLAQAPGGGTAWAGLDRDRAQRRLRADRAQRLAGPGRCPQSAALAAT